MLAILDSAGSLLAAGGFAGMLLFFAVIGPGALLAAVLAGMLLGRRYRSEQNGSPERTARHGGDQEAALRMLRETAAVLGIPEADIFHHAYHSRFHAELPRQAFERLFRVYIYQARLPSWVLEYCQRIQSLHRQGRLNRSRFSGSRPEPVTGQRKWLIMLVLSGMVFLLLLLLQWAMSASRQQDLSCLLPPCY